MPTLETIELIYKAFQENPNRLTYSTSKLQKQFNADSYQIAIAKRLYRLNDKDYVVAQALDTDLVYDSIPASELFEVSTGEKFRKMANDAVDDSYKEHVEQWEVKQKWVKGKDGSQLLVKKEVEIDYKKEFEQFVSQYKPKARGVRPYNYKQGNNNLAVVCMFDMHLGKLAHDCYTNNNDNISYQETEYEDEFQKLLWFIKSQNVDRILLPIGNDLFNVDNPLLTTVKGTPQDNTINLHKVFQVGINLLTLTIDALNEIAPVDVVLVPGNHSSTTETYLTLSLEAIYKGYPTITVDSNPLGRKYYTYGNNLIGLAHGELPLKRYAELLPFEAKEQFGQAEHIEILVGDKHVEEMFKTPILDGDGITVRRLAALTKTDVWHYKQGYTLSKRRSYILIYNAQDGITIQYTNHAS